MTTAQKPTPAQVLALQLDPERTEGRDRTIRDYLIRLLATLWREGADFSAKRPLGNSDWQWEIYALLVKAEYVPGSLDEDGYLDDVDHHEADKLIGDAIVALGEPATYVGHINIIADPERT